MRRRRLELIETEAQAWDLLAAALATNPEEVDEAFVGFEGWPRIEIHLPETPVDGSISPTMMRALLDLQESIYRAHKFVETDTGNLRLLLDKERDDLEFRVKVREGSSDYDIDLTAVMNRIGIEALSRMDSIHIVIAIVSVALIFAGGSAFKAWLASKAETRAAEVESEEKKAYLEARTAVAEEDTKRFQLLLEAQRRLPVLGEIDAAVDSARTHIVRAMSEERGGTIMGTPIDQEFGAEIVSTKRQASEKVRLAGYYRVDKVDTTVPDGFRVTLTDVNDGSSIVASMQDEIISSRHKQFIRDAEWGKEPVYIELTARRLRNRVVDAVVLAASQHQPQE